MFQFEDPHLLQSPNLASKEQKNALTVRLSMNQPIHQCCLHKKLLIKTLALPTSKTFLFTSPTRGTHDLHHCFVVRPPLFFFPTSTHCRSILTLAFEFSSVELGSIMALNGGLRVPLTVHNAFQNQRAASLAVSISTEIVISLQPRFLADGPFSHDPLNVFSSALKSLGCSGQLNVKHDHIELKQTIQSRY